MRFRNSLRLLIDNFGVVYKQLLFRFVTGLIFLSLAYVVMDLGLHTIVESAEANRILELLAEFFRALTSGKTAFLETFQEAFTQAVADFLILLGTNIGSIVWSVVGVCLLYLIVRFLNGTSLFAAASILNDKMASYAKTGFASAYVRTAGKAALYQVIYVPLTFVYDILSILACWFFFFFTPGFLPSWGVVTVLIGLSLSILAYLCLQALKMTFISSWIPSVIADGVGVAGGFRASVMHLRGFSGRFSTYLISLYLIVVSNVIAAVCTLGSLTLITVPASYIFLLCVQFVYYYEDSGKKFYLSFRKISGADGKPEGMGD